MGGYLTFVMDGRELAAPLDQVREVVRAVGVEPLAGVRAPVTGLLELRGDPLPVVDLRADAEPGERGDVIVLAGGRDGAVGLAVDRVVAVLGADAFVPEEGRPPGMPDYVTGILRTSDDAARPVFHVDLVRLAGLTPAPPPPAASLR